MASSFRARPRRGRILIWCAAAVIFVVGVAPTSAAEPPSVETAWFDTDEPAMITNLAGGFVDPIITVGDTIGGYMFEAIPDGIAHAVRWQADRRVRQPRDVHRSIPVQPDAAGRATSTTSPIRWSASSS